MALGVTRESSVINQYLRVFLGQGKVLLHLIDELHGRHQVQLVVAEQMLLECNGDAAVFCLQRVNGGEDLGDPLELVDLLLQGLVLLDQLLAGLVLALVLDLEAQITLEVCTLALAAFLRRFIQPPEAD